jgi:predicted dehydrogenase
MDRVRLALAGCGTIAQGMHLPGIKTIVEMGQAELVAVCDVDRERARAAAERFGAQGHFGGLDDLLAGADFDLLVNTTPIPDHFAVTLAALRAGKHVYTQKPMTTSVEEATQLINEAGRRGLTLACAPEHPVRSVIRTIADLVREGAIGKVAFAKVQSSHDGPEKHDVPRDSTWYYQPGSSPILDLGVHGLSQITTILGPVRRLACFSGRSLPERVTTAGPFAGKRIEVNIDDNSLLMLDFGAATFSYLDATYCVEASLGPRLEIHGNEGTIALAGRGEVRLYRSADKAWSDVPVPEAPPVRDLGVLHTVEHLREGTPLRLTAEHGRHLVEIMTQAPEAAATGRTLEMNTTF